MRAICGSNDRAATSWALVIGVDRYWTDAASLTCAVRDALAMREWLLDPAGGGVPEDQIVLLLSPERPDLGASEATYANIVRAIKRIGAESGERFYFHFAGHGLSGGLTGEQALAASDFSDDVPTHSVGLQGVLRYFQAAPFDDQFFFVDACRNVPYRGRFHIGELPWIPDLGRTCRIVQQFVFQATSPTCVAYELDERGAFTASLLEGLKGGGRAKAWDARGQEYVVRVNRLFDYVEQSVLETLSRAGLGGLQAPTWEGRLGAMGREKYPVLARIPRSAVPMQRLDVLVERAPPSAKLVVEPGGSIALPDSPTEPVSLDLQARAYELRVEAEGYECAPPALQIELYEALTVKFEMSVARDRNSRDPLPLYSERTGSGTRGRIFVDCDDETTLLEVVDEADRVLHVAAGSFGVALDPGIYTVRARTPNGIASQERLFVSEGEEHEVTLAGSPTGGVQAIRDDVLRGLEFTDRAAQGGRSCVQVVHWADAPGRTTLDPGEDIRISMAPMGHTETRWMDEIVPSVESSGARQFVAIVPAGSYWLRLDVQGHPAVRLPLTALPWRSTIVSLRRTFGSRLLSIYFAHPGFTLSALDVLETGQRFLERGHLVHAAVCMKSLVGATSPDLTACCISGYAMLQSGDRQGLDLIVRSMAVQYADLSDSHVFAMEAARARGDERATMASAAAALDRGLPMVLDGARRLLEVLVRRKMAHPAASTLADVVAHATGRTLWTACHLESPV